MRIKVIQRTHRLAHTAAVLEGEGHEVEAFVTRDHYRAAYRGILGRPQRAWEGGELGDVDLVLTDDHEVTEALEGASVPVFGSVRTRGMETSSLGFGMWAGSHALTCPHWVISELGVQHGGMGRRLPSSVALVAAPPSDLSGNMATHLTLALPPGFRGLCRVEVRVDPEFGQTMVPGVMRFGWPDLHAQLFLSQQAKLGDVFSNVPEMREGIHFATVLSIPPWPNPPTRASRPVSISPELAKELRAHLIWHDVAIRQGVLETCGLDGFVALGVARTKYLPTGKALITAAASQLGLVELQARLDAGSVIEQELSRLELGGLI